MIENLPDHILRQCYSYLDNATLDKVRLVSRRFYNISEQIVTPFRQITLEPYNNKLRIEKGIGNASFYISKEGFILVAQFLPRENADPIVSHYKTENGLRAFCSLFGRRRPHNVLINTDGMNDHFDAFMSYLRRMPIIHCNQLVVKSNNPQKIYQITSRFLAATYCLRGPINEAYGTHFLHENVKKCTEKLIVDMALSDINDIHVKEIFVWETQMTLDDLRKWIRTKTRDHCGMLYYVNVEADKDVDVEKVVNYETQQLYANGPRTTFKDYTAVICRVRRRSETSSDRQITTISLRYHKLDSQGPFFSHRTRF